MSVLVCEITKHLHYELRDLAGESIKRRFYEPELQNC